MQYMLLGDINLGLEDLQKERASILQKTKAGQVYSILLLRSLEGLRRLPPILLAVRPLVDELGSADDRHDSGAGKLWSTSEAAINDPLEDKEIKEAAKRIRRDIIPSLVIARASYPTKASNAKERRIYLVEREKDLKMFPMAGGKTLYDAAVQFFDAGDELDVLLSERAKREAVSEADRSEASAIRNTTVGYLTRFKAALEDELLADATLPRNLVSMILGYFEQLNETRRLQQNQRSNTKKASTSPSPLPPSNASD